MAEYFETEEIVKDYDSRIMARILRYVKPYKGLAFLTITALVISTMGELFLPILVQRMLDGTIMARYAAFDRAAFESADLSEEAVIEGKAIIGDKSGKTLGQRIFLPQGRLRISAKVEAELSGGGIIDREQWYVFGPGAEKPGGRAGAAAIYDEAEGTGAIRIRDLDSLTPEERRSLRRHDISHLNRSIVLFFGALALVLVFTFLQTWSTSLIGQRVMKDLRLELFKKTSGQSLDFLSRNPVGRIVTRLTSDVETINEFFTSVLVAFLKDFSIMAGVLITLLFLSPRLALGLLATSPPVIAAALISRLKARNAFRRQRTASSRVNSYLSERLSGIQVVQLFAGEKKSRREFGERNAELLAGNLEEMYVFAAFRPAVDFISNLTVAVILVMGAVLILHLSLSLGVLIAFISFTGMFFSPVQDIAEKYTILQSAMAGGERVFKLLDTDESIPDTGHAEIPDGVKGLIEFDRVNFSYKEGEPVLRDLSFTVQPGEMAAIVGYTGAGKTTITNVLTRLWDISSGSIRLDHIPVEQLPLGELRRSVLPVLQDVFLFSGTVADNIRLDLPLSQEEVEEAARTVHAHEFICTLPEGYETKLSEGATNISSGQRQLISFARVIAQNPRVVILDEATSSIDTETERLIQLGISRVLAGRTSIVIAHRLSTIRNASRILVLSGGRLVEEGCHEELIARDGLYAGLYRLQYEEGAAVLAVDI